MFFFIGVGCIADEIALGKNNDDHAGRSTSPSSVTAERRAMETKSITTTTKNTTKRNPL